MGCGMVHGVLRRIAEEGVQMCSSQEDKERVLSQMIFPNCERLGQTIIFVQRRETGRRLHSAVRPTSLPALPRSTSDLSSVP